MVAAGIAKIRLFEYFKRMKIFHFNFVVAHVPITVRMPSNRQ